VHSVSPERRHLTGVARLARSSSGAGRPARAAIVAACVLVGSHQAAALNLATALTQYDHDSWQVVDGLHRNAGEVVKQARDSGLWLDTFALEVTASGNGGPWNGSIVAPMVSVAPFFFQTGWFYGLCALVLLFAAFAAHRLRIRKIVARTTELAAQVTDRTARLEEANVLLNERNRELEEANRRLELLSTQDSLTEAANRRQFDHVLDAEWRRCARTGLSLALLMLDIDHFKPFNDGYGHVPGDDCLKKVAGVVRRLVQRAGELVARYGGEEFAVLLPGSDAPHARELAETIRQEVEHLAIPHAHSKVAPVVTISAGVAAMIPIYGNTPGELISAADRALYHAKQTGRNRVSLTPPG